MDTAELTRALRAATDDLAPRAEFTTEVLRGGRRRQFRGRLAITGAVAVVAGITATAVISLGGEPIVSAAQTPAVLTEPTKGDLAGDQAYLAQAVAAFQRGMEISPNKDRVTDSPLIDSPHVYWAGTTPVGKVALVAQARKGQGYYEAGKEGKQLSKPITVGLITGDQPVLVNDSPVAGRTDANGGVGFLLGAGDRYAVAISDGGPLWASPKWVIGADGTGRRAWTEMTQLDGIGFYDFGAATTPGRARLVRSPDPNAIGDNDPLIMLPGSTYADGFDRQGKVISQRSVNWAVDAPIVIPGATGKKLSDLAEARTVLADRGLADRLGSPAMGGFEVIGNLTEGRSVAGFEYLPDGDGSRFYAAVLAGDRIEAVVYGGVMDPAAVVPAKAKLPGEAGWLVVKPGAKIEYQVGGGGMPWVDAGTGAAVLPAVAAEVRITVAGQAPRTATL